MRKLLFLSLAIPLMMSTYSLAENTIAPSTSPTTGATTASAYEAPATTVKGDVVDQAVDGAKKFLNDDDDDHDHSGGNSWLEDAVPIASFIFVLILVLGSRYMKEQSARQRLSVLKMMIEKGQPVSDSVVKEMMASAESRKNVDPLSARQKQLRNGFALTGIGVALCAYRVLGESGHHEKALVFGLLSLGLGIGLLVAHKLSGNNTQS